VLAAAAFAAAAATRPRFSREHRAVDAGIVACLTFAALQSIPLPPMLRLSLSPASAVVERAVLLVPPDPAGAPWHALTLSPSSTAWSLLQAAAAVAVFWTARSLFERGGALRITVRGLVWLGLALACITFVQRALSPHLFYGIWTPIARTDNPSPLGPFLNRNDLAAWLDVAVLLAIGYLLARIRTHAAQAAPSLEDALDSRTAIAAASGCLMTALLLASGSRSGIVSCAAGTIALIAMTRARLSSREIVGLAAGLILLALVATLYVSLPALGARFGDVFAPDLGRGRVDIWRQTWPIARDFWRTGVGLGAFEHGMIVYQQRPFELFINQAHNQYLQLLVEGGLPLLALVLITLAAGVVEAARRLRTDHTGVAWMRAGAIAAGAALAVQGIWDTGLRMPANSILFAIACSVALHGARDVAGASSARPLD
jgi:O-antigen ligase